MILRAADGPDLGSSRYEGLLENLSKLKETETAIWKETYWVSISLERVLGWVVNQYGALYMVQI